MIGDVLQPTHLIFILVVALLVLGPKRLPEVGRSLGKGIRDFRGAVSGITDSEPTVPPEPPDVQVTPVTPATTALPVEESTPFSVEDSTAVPVEDATVEPSAALAERPVPAPSSVADTAGLGGTDASGAALLPHVEPDEIHSAAPAADPSHTN